MLFTNYQINPILTFVIHRLLNFCLCFSVFLFVTDLVHATSSSKPRPILSKKQQAVYQQQKSGAPKVTILRFWKDPTGIEGERRIEVILSKQLAVFYVGDSVVGKSSISSGKTGYETRLGSFNVISKRPEHFSNLYGSFINAQGKTVGYGSVGDTPPAGTRYEPSPMPFFIRLTHQGLGLHAGFLPGYADSHGCIRLPKDMAQKYFEAIPIGGRVDIIP